MSINSSVITALTSIGLPIQTGMYTGAALNYIVLVPLGERSEDIADDSDITETEDIYINLYYVGNYISTKNSIKSSLKSSGFFIADSNYIELDEETGQHHYVFTVEKKTIL